jgi:hypothetical protein
VRLKHDGTRWRTGGELKGKLANGVGSQYSHTTSKHGVPSITNADVHTSAASNRLNWRPRRFKWIRPFRRKTKSGFWACAITFQTQYNRAINNYLQEVFALPRCYAALYGSWLPKFQNGLAVPSPKVKQSKRNTWPFKRGKVSSS